MTLKIDLNCRIVSNEEAVELAQTISGERVDTASLSVTYGLDTAGKQVIVIVGADDQAILINPAVSQS